MAEALRSWEADCGFGGSVWACRDEFLGADYQDRDAMYGLLTAEMYEVYLGLWKDGALV